MVRLSTLVVGLMVCGAVVGASSPVHADHGTRFGVLWPKIYAPTITGNLFEDDDYVAEDPAFRQRMLKKRKLAVEDYEPQYQAPKPRIVRKQAVRTIDDVKKPINKVKIATVVRPKLKPLVAQMPVAAVPTPTLAKLVLPTPAAAPKTNKPAIAAPAPANNTIGCSKGVEIITGYGFSGVKPKSCAGTAYAFDAQRANAAYVITLSAATGEITDVKKL